MGDKEVEVNKERIALINPVVCINNIEDWLGDLERSMQLTLKTLIYKCYSKFVAQKEPMDTGAMLNETCGQVALIAIQMRWTKLIQDSFMER